MSNLEARISAAHARLDAQVAAAALSREQLVSSIDELRALRVTAQSARGDIAVTATPDGTIVDVRIDSSARPGDELGQQVTLVIDEAQAAARAAAIALVSERFGSDSPLARQLIRDSRGL